MLLSTIALLKIQYEWKKNRLEVEEYVWIVAVFRFNDACCECATAAVALHLCDYSSWLRLCAWYVHSICVSSISFAGWFEITYQFLSLHIRMSPVIKKFSYGILATVLDFFFKFDWLIFVWLALVDLHRKLLLFWEDGDLFAAVVCLQVTCLCHARLKVSKYYNYFIRKY